MPTNAARDSRQSQKKGSTRPINQATENIAPETIGAERMLSYTVTARIVHPHGRQYGLRHNPSISICRAIQGASTATDPQISITDKLNQTALL